MRWWLGAAGAGDSVRPRRLSGVVVRPLNLTVRAHDGRRTLFQRGTKCLDLSEQVNPCLLMESV